MKKLFTLIIITLLLACSDKNFEKGVENYKLRKFKEAIIYFNKAKEIPEYSNDAKIYLQKIDSIISEEKRMIEVADKTKKEKDFKDLITIYKEDDVWTKGKSTFVDLNEILTQIFYYDDLDIISKKALSNADPEIKAMAEYMQKNIPRIKTRDFPVFRKEYVRILGKNLWRENVEVEISGPKNNTITFIGGLFASNANIEDAQKEVHKTLTTLRFKKSRYKWIKSASEFTSYTIKSKNDNE